jgi:hypothetical protein
MSESLSGWIDGARQERRVTERSRASSSRLENVFGR